MIFLGFTRICRKIVDVAIYALYPESFCENFAIRKVFAFSDSDLWYVKATQGQALAGSRESRDHGILRQPKSRDF